MIRSSCNATRYAAFLMSLVLGACGPDQGSTRHASTPGRPFHLNAMPKQTPPCPPSVEAQEKSTDDGPSDPSFCEASVQSEQRDEMLAGSVASEGCQFRSSATGFRNVSIKVGSRQRSFIRVVAADYDHTVPHKLVIGFHGHGLDGNSPRRDHKWPLIEQMAGDAAIFIYPHSAGASWNGGAGSPDLAFFDELVKTTGEEFCVDKSKVFVHGFSNGSIFVNSLVRQRGAAIRGLITVAGSGGGVRVPAMVIHGQADPTIAYSHGMQSLRMYAQANSCQTPVDFNKLAMDTCTALPGCAQATPLIFCPWRGNHHWPEFTLSQVWQFIAAN